MRPRTLEMKRINQFMNYVPSLLIRFLLDSEDRRR